MNVRNMLHLCANYCSILSEKASNIQNESHDNNATIIKTLNYSQLVTMTKI